MSNILQLPFLKYGIIICGIYLFLFSICLFFIFKKEKLNKFFAFIPLVNLICYFRICNIPVWIIFVPIINIIAFMVSPYKILILYGYNKSMSLLSIFLPFIFIPHLAFSNKKKINHTEQDNTIKTIYDVEQIESKLEENKNAMEEFYSLDYNLDSTSSNDNSYENQKIAQIENNINSNYNFIEEFDDFTSINIQNSIQENNNNDTSNDIIEIDDERNDYITTGMMDTIENSIIEKANIAIVDNSDYKEYEPKQERIENIAFGGEQKIEDRIHAKTEELKCDRCGSSLVGANGYCPGCGKKI